MKETINDFPCVVILYKNHLGVPELSIECMNSFAEYKINKPFSIPDVTKLLIKNQDHIVFQQFRQVDKIQDDQICNQYNFVGRDVDDINTDFNHSKIGFRSLGYVINLLKNAYGYISCNHNEKLQTRILNEDIDLKYFDIMDNDYIKDECGEYELLTKTKLLVKDDNIKMNFIHLFTSNQNYMWLDMYNKSLNDYVTCVIPSDIFSEKMKEFGIFGFTIYGLDGTLELFIDDAFYSFVYDYVIEGEVDLDINTRVIKFKYKNSNEVIEDKLD